MTQPESRQPPSGAFNSPGAQGPANPAANEAPRDVPEGAQATSGRRQAFRNLERSLSDTDLDSTGARKLLLDAFYQADSRCEALEQYQARFHEADKHAAVLEEKVRTSAAIDVFFGVGVGLGGAILGLAPFFWEKGALYGVMALIVGAGLVCGAIAGRLVKR